MVAGRLDELAEHLAYLGGRARVARATVIERIDERDALARDLPHYFRVGQSALTAIIQAMTATGRRDYARILDFAAGYGRVTRYLRAFFRDSAITAADRDGTALSFCATTFGVEPWQLGEEVLAATTAERFDLIWCGSVLTHLPAEAAIRLLDRLTQWLAPGGLLLVTSHGRRAIANQAEGRVRYLPEAKFAGALHEYRRAGYGFAGYDDRPGVGCSLSSGAWLLARIEERSDLTVVLFAEKAWDDHHDVLALARLPV